MRRLILNTVLFLSVISSSALQGQESINRTDQDGRKQGKWIKKFENGNTLYEGVFKNNRPIGEFKRYYISGQLISVLNYHESEDIVEAIFYHPSGYLAARGTYVDQKKEGEWAFYSARKKDCIICIESYLNNLKEGKSIKYHLNGNRAEELIYVNGVKHGIWIQYYTDEVKSLKSQYENGKLKGPFETFHLNGVKEIIGNYSNDVRTGDWNFYNDDGTTKRKIVYVNGVAENDAELIREETDYLDMLEKNGGKIIDPEKSGTIW